MIRYFLAKGDRGGNAVITEGLEFVTCSNPPPRVQIATLYMKTYCTACKQEGFIAPEGPRLPGTGPNGQQWALSGDVNVCGCSPPPVFYAERGMKMILTSEDAIAAEKKQRIAEIDEKRPAAGTRSDAAPTYDEQVRVWGRHEVVFVEAGQAARWAAEYWENSDRREGDGDPCQ